MAASWRTPSFDKPRMEVNLIGVGRLTRPCLPYMRAGRIVNVSSIGGKCAFAFAGWYHASKFALEGDADSLRMEVRASGIDVIAIEPGGMDAEWFPVAIEALERHWAGGALGALVKAMPASPAWRRKMPPPRVISDLIVKAPRVRRSRTRRHGAGWIRWLLSDRVDGRLITTQYRQAAFVDARFVTS
ncbi:SDR family NAD(P)-dependent oxidoreductase [Burkholderia plantarii]|uniref:SDR family NAD(P)-dependent oxidoreductase n=1 Tax=Burkholderia plantarii TaxID=41899 RepID=UPI0018DD371A|nr:SDR family NAD(P)-dependent oxidoreductase [Burkholderia plantarii]MBI0330691.1 SDR family NAD(P)-dependent oxidoreductase [Burkholderia plantarii]